MSTIAIQVEKLSKQYRIGTKQESYHTLRDTLTDTFAAPFRRVKKLLQGQATGAADLDEIIWALKDVSFKVEHGEVLGVIGRNGAGKSTLLKVLSRITEPSAGRARICGRVGSLLEVGTGFHPELTGRENIFLNGAILGMRREEIERKFDEIVAFSEVERFIDTPVKHYSSGMYLRLAFAVAAHLQPEILLVDEVLAVGDSAFQKKCLGKMRDVAEEGRTVLFVSHNMGAVSQLCSRALWIDDGQIKSNGPSAEVVAQYLTSVSTSSSTWINQSNNFSELKARIKSATLINYRGELETVVDFNKPFKVEIVYDVYESTKRFAILCRLTNMAGEIVWTSWDVDTTDWSHREREPGRYVSICTVNGNLLRPGPYLVSVGSLTPRGRFLSYHEHVLTFEISSMGFPLNLDRGGVITPLLEWEIQKIRLV
ncbi:MAG: ABC transporter ATP-binding protein [bacterium]